MRFELSPGRALLMAEDSASKHCSSTVWNASMVLAKVRVIPRGPAVGAPPAARATAARGRGKLRWSRAGTRKAGGRGQDEEYRWEHNVTLYQ